MKRDTIACLIMFLGSTLAYAQTNLYPSSGNVKIFGADEAWAEGISIVKPSGWSGVRFTRNNPSGGNFNGNWAIGYGGNTGNDFLISTNYNGTQYDGLFHISNSTRNVGIGTTSPEAKFTISQIGNGWNDGLRINRDASNYLTLTEDVTDIRLKNWGSGGLIFFTSAAEGMRILNNGNVGIGTSGPSYKLQVSGGAIALDDDQPVRGGGRWLISGNQTSVTVGTANPGINLRLMAGGNAAERILIDGTTGNVGIGTTSPNQKLTVNGTIYGKEVKVDLSVPGPDYVFEENYKLPSLEEIKTYIDQHKHLPEVPSAKEMEANGINVGEMNMILLKKVEELTLMLIESDKKFQEQERVNAEHKQLLEKILTQIDKPQQ